MSERHLSAADLDLLVVGDAAGADRRQIRSDLERHARELVPTCEQRWERRLQRRVAFERPGAPAPDWAAAESGDAWPACASWRCRGRWFRCWGPRCWSWRGRGRQSRRSRTGPCRRRLRPLGMKGVPGLAWSPAGASGVRGRLGGCFRPGDALRFVLEPRSAVPADRVGGWTGEGEHLSPVRRVKQARVAPAEDGEAPAGSVVLDAAPGPERIFALWSSEPLQAADVIARLNDSASGVRRPSAQPRPSTCPVPYRFPACSRKGTRHERIAPLSLSIIAAAVSPAWRPAPSRPPMPRPAAWRS